MNCLCCGEDREIVQHYEDGGYCEACKLSPEEWLREQAAIAEAQRHLDGEE